MQHFDHREVPVIGEELLLLVDSWGAIRYVVQMEKYIPGSPMGDCWAAPFEALVLVRLDILVFSR